MVDEANIIIPRASFSYNTRERVSLTQRKRCLFSLSISIHV